MAIIEASVELRAVESPSGTRAYWPSTAPEDFCGEGQPNVMADDSTASRSLVNLTDVLLDVIREAPGLNQRLLVARFADRHHRDDITTALVRLEQNQRIRIERTSKGHAHYAVDGIAKQAQARAKGRR